MLRRFRLPEKLFPKTTKDISFSHVQGAEGHHHPLLYPRIYKHNINESFTKCSQQLYYPYLKRWVIPDGGASSQVPTTNIPRTHPYMGSLHYPRKYEHIIHENFTKCSQQLNYPYPRRWVILDGGVRTHNKYTHKPSRAS